MIRIGQAIFDRENQRLRLARTQNVLTLWPQSMRVLELLIDANGGLMSKDQLIERVWGKLEVTDDSLVQCIKEIRVVIVDTDHSLLKTFYSRVFAARGLGASRHEGPSGA
jgi:DNA-binding winged helix-turn-helix (wHTH) protein